MKIPKSFKLAGVTWTVHYCDIITDMGQCDSEKYTIRIRDDLSEQARQATFCHEFEHARRYMLGEDDHDEKDVDRNGNLLHQFLVQFAEVQRAKK